MVGPSITDEEREQFLFRLRVGFSLFVGASMALVVLAGDGDPPTMGGAFLAGTVVGPRSRGGCSQIAWVPDREGDSRSGEFRQVSSRARTPDWLRED